MNTPNRPKDELRKKILILSSLAMQVPRERADVSVQYAGYVNSIYVEIDLGGYELGGNKANRKGYNILLDFSDAEQELDVLIKKVRNLFFKPDEKVSEAMSAGGGQP